MFLRKIRAKARHWLIHGDKCAHSSPRTGAVCVLLPHQGAASQGGCSQERDQQGRLPFALEEGKVTILVLEKPFLLFVSVFL